MDWPVIEEFVPGVGVGPEGIPFLCPGCFAKDMGQDVPAGTRLAQWFAFALKLLAFRGYEVSDLNAEEMARDYEEEPWHVD